MHSHLRGLPPRRRRQGHCSSGRLFKERGRSDNQEFQTKVQVLWQPRWGKEVSVLKKRARLCCEPTPISNGEQRPPSHLRHHKGSEAEGNSWFFREKRERQESEGATREGGLNNKIQSSEHKSATRATATHHICKNRRIIHATKKCEPDYDSQDRWHEDRRMSIGDHHHWRFLARRLDC